MPEARAADYGGFSNVTHTLAVTNDTRDLCNRTLAGTLELTWPEPNSYYDEILVQDISESFQPHIKDETIQNAMREMVSMLTLGKEANNYPRDRVMFVSFAGTQGEAYTNFTDTEPPAPATTTYTDFSGQAATYKVEFKKLTENASTIEAAIQGLDNNFKGDSTPTIDVLMMARDEYLKELKDTNPYDNATNVINGVEKTRRTVYVLTTDGLVDTSTYDNLTVSLTAPDPDLPPPPVASIPTKTTTAYTWYGEDNERAYFLHYYNNVAAQGNVKYDAIGPTGEPAGKQKFREFTDSLGRKWYLKDPDYHYMLGPDGTYVHDYGFYQMGAANQSPPVRYEPLAGLDYQTQLAALAALGDSIKDSSGVPQDASTTAAGSAYIVTGYWGPDPDTMSLPDQYGYLYSDPSAATDIQSMARGTIQNLASTRGMSVVNTDISLFTQQMTVTNTLDTIGTLPLVKVDGAGAPIPGITFTLTSQTPRAARCISSSARRGKTVRSRLRA